MGTAEIPGRQVNAGDKVSDPVPCRRGGTRGEEDTGDIVHGLCACVDADEPVHVLPLITSTLFLARVD
jgi:hypothetical protein